MLATRRADGDVLDSRRRWRPPSVCAICRGWGRQRICRACVDGFARPTHRCARCALPLASAGSAASICGACLAAPPPFDAALAAVDYAPPWDRLVTAFKFHDAVDLATPFAEAIAAVALARAAPRPALLLPVPLAPSRLRARGYNQAWELARRLARRLCIDPEPMLLLRWRETVHQLALPPLARSGNVAGAFAIEPRRRGEIAGRDIAIVDDVMTTGSTAAEIARVLRQAGAARIEIWMFARTPRPEDA